MTKKSWVDSGRIETVLACVVLAAVIGLFVRFYRPTTDPVPAASEMRVPAAAQPAPTH